METTTQNDSAHQWPEAINSHALFIYVDVMKAGQQLIKSLHLPASGKGKTAHHLGDAYRLREWLKTIKLPWQLEGGRTRLDSP